MSEQQVPGFAQLLDWLEGRVSEQEAARIAAGVAQSDPASAANLAWLRAFLAVSASTILIPPPPEVRAELGRRFAAQLRRERPASLLRRVVAALTYDSKLQPLTAGLRAGASGAQRQLVYETEAADIALNIQPRSRQQNLDVYGQVLPRASTILGLVSVQMLRDMHEQAIAFADTLGEFTFESVPPGTYELVVTMDELEVVIGPVALTS